MAIIKCKMCGGDLAIIEGLSVAECEYCGTRQTVPAADNDKKLTLFARANRLRSSCEFDKAAGIYEAIVTEFPQEAESYWGLVLCKYGIEYVDDPATGRKIPTCHRSSFDSVLDDSNFHQAMENADEDARILYRQEAKQIERIRQGILEVSSTEQPYDIFICYKETDAKGNRTADSLLAQDIYDALTGKGYRVFFSRISLEDKLGQAYEPYIFAALNSARIMLAVGTSYENYHAVWVKNEWSRYIKVIQADKNKYLIPCYSGLDPSVDLPREFAHLQGQDMDAPGAVSDLLRGIEKLLQHGSQTATQSGSNVTAESLLKRAYMFLEDQLWDSADAYYEKVLDMDPENPQAYLGKLLAEHQVVRVEDLSRCPADFTASSNYPKALRFGDEALCKALEDARRRNPRCRKKDAAGKQKKIRNTILTVLAAILLVIAVFGLQKPGSQPEMDAKSSEMLTEEAYLAAVSLMDAGRYAEAMEAFATLEDYRDSAAKAEYCRIAMNASPEEEAYREAEALAAEGKHAHAGIAFANLGEYKDARERSFEQWSYTRRRRTIAYGIYPPAGKFWVGVKNDGTAVATGSNTFGQTEVEGWTDIVEVAALSFASLGLKADGTVVTAGSSGDQSQQDMLAQVRQWTDIVAIHTYDTAHDGGSVYGLKQDGTLTFAGSIPYDPAILEAWTDLVDLCQIDHLVGLKMDGTVVAASKQQEEAEYEQCQVGQWRNIVSVDAASIYRSHTMGLQADGTVEFTGAISTTEWKLEPYHGKVEGWTDIVDVCGPIGLHADGTVSVFPEDAVFHITGETIGYWKDAVADWEGVVALRGGGSTIYGLKADGTVLGAGTMGNGALNVSDWRDIQDLIVANYHIGIKSDGSLEIAEHVNSEMVNWTDIRLP